MPPHSASDYDAAVALVLGGMSVKSAWEQSGEPGTSRDSGQRNIRQRVKRAREAEVAAPLPSTSTRTTRVLSRLCCRHAPLCCRRRGTAARGARVDRECVYSSNVHVYVHVCMHMYTCMCMLCMHMWYW